MLGGALSLSSANATNSNGCLVEEQSIIPPALKLLLRRKTACGPGMNPHHRDERFTWATSCHARANRLQAVNGAWDGIP
jgi:hypothetical protein